MKQATKQNTIGEILEMNSEVAALFRARHVLYLLPQRPK